jgi:cystathionine beta-lyase/cystathionine gamma-synthase
VHDRLELIARAASLGGIESLVSIPARMSHRHLTPEQRKQAGIGDGLLRLSIGLEAPEDLIADLDQALRRG